MKKHCVATLCVLLVLAGCDDVSSDTPTNTLPGPSTELDVRLDAEMAILRQALPQKMADSFDMTDARRSGKDVTYVYQFHNASINTDDIDLAAGKKAVLPELCNTASTRQYLDAGYRFVYTYRFKQGADVVVHVVAADCKTL